MLGAAENQGLTKVTNANQQFYFMLMWDGHSRSVMVGTDEPHGSHWVHMTWQHLMPLSLVEGRA